MNNNTNSIVVKDRHLLLLKYLPVTGGNVTKAAIMAGFATSTANKKQKSLLATAMRKSTYEMANIDPNTTNKKEMMEKLKIRDKIGMSRNDVFDNYKSVIEQDRDMGNKLKALAPLLAEEDINLTDVEQKTQPVLNITVEKHESPTPVDYELE